MHYLVLSILLIVQDGPKSITDYYRLFTKDGGASLEDENNDVTIDEANAYIQVIDHGTDDYRFDTEIQFVYFLTSAKTKVFGYSVIERGPPNTDRFDYSFYKYEKQQWIDVTNEVLPEELSLELFANTPEDVDGVGSQYQLEMTLPQKGTSIIVKPQMVSEIDNPFSEDSDGYSHYLQVFGRLVKSEIQLKWNREKEIFELAQ